ncbi:MAG: hypothetical protein NVS2B6_16660 [Thermoleophilaceae bacterium]
MTDRHAIASASVAMAQSTIDLIEAGDAPKGDVLAVARFAGIQAAKRTAELIPLCHPLALSYVDVDLVAGGGRVTITAEARTSAQTGVEMEAMTAAAIAALTVYDMVKGVDRGARVEQVALEHKSGGRSDWERATSG